MTADLDLLKIAHGAFLIPWRDRRAFVRALATPLAAIVVCAWCWSYLVEQLSPLFGWVMLGPYLALFVLFAVTCHRLVLLDPHEVARHVVPRWGARETRFALMLIALFVISQTLIALAASVVAGAGARITEARDTPFELLLFLALLPACYLVARLSVLLPATAVGERVGFKWAWELTRGNGWRLVALVAGLPFALSAAVGLLDRSGATLLENMLVSVISYALLAIEVSALSLSYYELSRASTR